MAWYIDGKRIYVEEDTGWGAIPRIGKIDVLDSTSTILHTAGVPSYTRTLTFVVFSGYASDILPLASGCEIDLIPDQGATEVVVIERLQAKRLRDISRVTPVYRVTMELIDTGKRFGGA